jgi:hypothetical protein
MDFANALHLASSGTATAFATFDQRLAKAAWKNLTVVASPPDRG